MPSVIYEASLTDAGDAVMGGTRVYYVAWEITTHGPAMHHYAQWDPYTETRAGYVQLGNDLTPGGLISGIGYDAPIWFNNDIGQWIVKPTLSGSDFTALLAQYVRWALTPGTEVHLVVFGDS